MDYKGYVETIEDRLEMTPTAYAAASEVPECGVPVTSTECSL